MKTNSLRPLLGVSLVLAAVNLHAAAATEPGAAKPVQPVDALTIDFAIADKNTDGGLTKEEALVDPGLAGAFDGLDADRNGTLTPAEFSRWARAGKAKAAVPADPSTAPTGSAGAQHMRDRE